ADGRRARVGRGDEPADPLRRGSDEPCLVRDDASGVGEGVDTRRPRLPREADCRAAKEAGIERDDLLEVTIVGNPIMHHLFLGLVPPELGSAPFALAVDEAVRRPARDLGLPTHPGARVYVLPCIAGHVGADTAGVILSEGPYLGDEVNLVVDVGTNAEI